MEIMYNDFFLLYNSNKIVLCFKNKDKIYISLCRSLNIQGICELRLNTSNSLNPKAIS